MNELRFVQLQKEDNIHFERASSVWVPFIREVNAHDGKIQSDESIISGLQKRIAIQGSRQDMHFEIAMIDDATIGISMFAIDLGTIHGMLEHPGYGTIMGFYIKPEFRRMGYGKLFFEHIQALLRMDGTKKLYLCPDSVTGVPFWSAMGFVDSGLIDPDDRKPIYIKM